MELESKGKQMKQQLNLFVTLYKALIVFILFLPYIVYSAENISLSVRDIELSEVMEMLSRQERVNILLSENTSARISVNLYDMELAEAIRVIANSAGFEIEVRDNIYYVINRDDVGRYSANGTTDTRAFRLKYANSTEVRTIIEEQLSDYGSVTELVERNLLVVEDKPEFLSNIETLINDLDYRPRQILIEARILEVTLDESEVFGIEWSKIFESSNGLIGTRGLSSSGAGFFVDYVDDELNLFLDALQHDGRTRTLSTPKLLALENQPASVIIGDRLGYINTVTINQVTTENTEFLESGIILEVTPTVDENGQIMLDIHPEISTGTVTDGVPSQSTTSVRTQLLVPSGGTSFIGGLIKSQKFTDQKGVPGLSKIPLAGKLFSRNEERNVNTEIIILITPTLIDSNKPQWQQEAIESVNEAMVSPHSIPEIHTRLEPVIINAQQSEQ